MQIEVTMEEILNSYQQYLAGKLGPKTELRLISDETGPVIAEKVKELKVLFTS